MSKISVEYCSERVTSPLTFWVHRALDNQVWLYATKHDPPLPAPVIGKGYPKYQIEHRSHLFFFISREEILHCIEVLSQKVLPSARALSSSAGHSESQHLHWLARWPGDAKSWKDRQKIVKLLEKLLAEVE